MPAQKFSLTDLKREMRKRWFILVIGGLYLLVGGLFALLIYGFGWDQSATRGAAVIYPLPAATVNGDPIWLSSYYRRLRIYEHYDLRVQAEQPDLLPEDPYERKRRVLDELVQIMLLKEEAKKAGITVTQQEIDETFNQVVEANGGQADFEKVLVDFYGINPEDFAREFIPEQLYRQKIQAQLFTQIHVRHIVLADRNAAQEVLDKIKAGGDFTELAKNFSQDTQTRDQGGDLGFARRGQFVAPFEEAAFALDVGGVTGELVETPFGFHIIKLDERQEAQISDQSFSEWFTNLIENAKVKRFVPKEPAVEADTTLPEESAPAETAPVETPAA